MAIKKISPFTLFLQEELAKATSLPIVIRNAITVNGGSINECFVLDTSSGKFFLKRNSEEDFPLLFENEKKGLDLLRKVDQFKVPELILSGTFNDKAYLVFEFIESGHEDLFFWEKFGRALASLHKITNENYGLEYNNYIGSLKQSNAAHHSWVAFFKEERITPQLNLALEKKRMSRDTYDKFQVLFQKIEHLFPVEVPALLHGDLWSGNFLCAQNGMPVVFDPAVYYGHREMDIAMTKLFGGFNAKFYSAYNEVWPLENNWKERVDLCNLYPLLVHLNLFGGTYLKQIQATLTNFS